MNQNRTIKPDIPNKRTHVLATQHPHQPEPPPTLSATEKKKRHEKRAERGANAQEIPPRPPKRKQEKHSEDEARDLARVGVEPARDERGANQPRTEVPSREREPRDAAGHARRAALVRCFMFVARARAGFLKHAGVGDTKGRKEDKRRTIELDGVDVCACEDAHERVAHLFVCFFQMT